MAFCCSCVVISAYLCGRNVEAALGGKSDPYVRVQVRNVTKGRTEVINNSEFISFPCAVSFSDWRPADLNPVWDQIIYIPGKCFPSGSGRPC